MPRSEDELAARRPLARDGAVSAGHLPPAQRHGTAQNRGGEKWGETEESMGGPLRGHPLGYGRSPRT
jgi:hypothetical protein